MTTLSPTTLPSGNKNSTSVHWTSIKLNLIMIPVSIGILILLIVIVFMCHTVRTRQNKALARQRQREIRMSKKKYADKLNEGLRNAALAKAHSENISQNGVEMNMAHMGGNDFCPQGNTPTSVRNTVGSWTARESRTENINCVSDHISARPATLVRQGTFTIEKDSEEQQITTTRNPSTSPVSGLQVELSRRDTYTIDTGVHNEQSKYEMNLNRSSVDKLKSVEDVKSGLSTPNSPVKASYTNGTAPHPLLDSPTRRERKIWNRPPSASFCVTILKHDHKIIPAINHLPAVK